MFWKKILLLWFNNFIIFITVIVSNSAADLTCPAKFGYFPDPNDCQGYYICTFGNAKTRKCGNGLHYKTTTQSCDKPKPDNCVQEADQASRPKYSGPMMKTGNDDKAPAQQPPAPLAPPETPQQPPDDQNNSPSLATQASTQQQYPPNQAPPSYPNQDQSDNSSPDFSNNPSAKKQPDARTKNADFSQLTNQVQKPNTEATTSSYDSVKKPSLFGPVATKSYQYSQPTKPPPSDSTGKSQIDYGAKKGYSDLVMKAFNSKPSFGNKKKQPITEAPSVIQTTTVYSNQDNNNQNINDNGDNDQSIPQKTFDNPSRPSGKTRNPASGSPSSRNRPQPDSNDWQQNTNQDANPDQNDGNQGPDQNFNKQNWQTSQQGADDLGEQGPRKSNKNDGFFQPPQRNQNSGSNKKNWQDVQQGNDDNFERNDPILKAASQKNVVPPSQNVNQGLNKKFQPVQGQKPRPKPETPQEIPVEPSTAQCNVEACQLPSCLCGSTKPPGGISLKDTPQMVLLSFDAEINERNLPIYEQIFHKNRKNPSGCNIKATFFVSHEFTNYGMVRYLYEKGHEIGSHSITHGVGTGFKDEKAWETEMGGEKGFLASFASIRPDDIKGARAPLLGAGADDQFQALQAGNFQYDSTLTTTTSIKAPFWPYTLDYGVPHACGMPACPQSQYPGIWELPLNPIYGLFGESCYEADRCTFGSTGDEVYKLLYNNFYDKYYSVNRAPFQLAIHADWLKYPPHREAFERFLDLVASMPDVWIVTGSQAVAWMQNPTPIGQLNTFAPWQCSADDILRLPQCDTINACPLPFRDRLRYFYTCSDCPAEFPWIPEA